MRKILYFSLGLFQTRNPPAPKNPLPLRKVLVTGSHYDRCGECVGSVINASGMLDETKLEVLYGECII